MKKKIIPLLFISLIFTIMACTEVNKKSKTSVKQPEKIIKDSTKLRIFTTAKNMQLRLSETKHSALTKSSQPSESDIFVYINTEKTFQTFVGIGGAITDASAEVFSKLSEKNKEKLLNSYFSEEGIGYKVIRTNINSCDFSSKSYTYINDRNKNLESFSVAHDLKYRIPMIKRALKKINSDPFIYASPWSPPAFMKTNNNMLQGGKLLPEYYQTWANYYVKFIEAYKKEGIKIDGLTVQNEPMAKQKWESCIYTAEEERDFVKNYLGPTLHNSNLENIKLIVWDHNRDLISHRSHTILDDMEARKYVWGVGFHWYETWTKGEPMWNNLANVQESYPNVNLIFTEGCNEGFDSTQYYRWSNAERYGKSMINDFNNGTVAWTDWNILLDENGGPNHVGNFCFAPIHANTQTDELIFTPSYYYIGHFSKFIQPNAKRLSASSSRSTIQATAFKNPNGEIITIVMNETDNTLQYKLIVDDRETLIELPSHSIQTIII